MEIQVEEISPAKRKLEVKVPKEKVDAELNTIFQNLRKQVRVKGFRPGKVPMSIIKSLYREEALNKALSNLIEKTYPEALKEAQLRPLKETNIEPEKLVEGKEFKYAVEMEVIPEFDLPPYKGVSVEVTPIVVTEEEVETELNRLREMHAELESIEEPRPAQKGDYVILSFQGYQDGEPLETFKSDDYMAELGKNQLHEDIEKELLGTQVGEEKVIELTYPEDYQNKELAGKKIELHVKIKDIKEKILPPLDDEFVKSLEDNYEGVAELRNALKEQIKEKKEKIREEYIKNYILTHLTENAEIELPDSLVEEELESMIERALQFTTPEVRKSLNLDKMKEDLRPNAEKKVKAQLILSKIAQEENITAEEKEVEEELKLIAENLKVPLEKMQNPYVISRIQTRIIGEKALVFLKEHADIKEVEKKEEVLEGENEEAHPNKSAQASEE
ncbi:MAG: trigger factor [Candidatus Desulfofervidaceae bacterium]|nr:trigger factor [Candidatus Desulfofervidaceae bacterium]